MALRSFTIIPSAIILGMFPIIAAALIAAGGDPMPVMTLEQEVGQLFVVTVDTKSALS